MRQTSIKNLLHFESDALGTILTQVKLLQRWNRWLTEALPDEAKLLEHCQIIRLDKSTLIVIADNPHWSTRFRFFIPQLLDKLKQHPDFKHLKMISCKVRPLNFQKAPLPKPAAKLSIENAQLFIEIAEKIQDPRLREAIEKIAKNMTKTTQI